MNRRMHTGGAHELEVGQRIQQAGYVINQFGQGLFKDELRAILQSYDPPLLVRWLPDFIAAHPTKRQRIFLVDAKSGRLDTGRHAIEINALIAHHALYAALRVRVVYVWADFTCGFAHGLRPVAQNLPIDAHVGSGTPYYLVAHDDQLAFDAVFA